MFELIWPDPFFLNKCTKTGGGRGDGSTPGTCGAGYCNSDGTCTTTCGFISSIPHSGCSDVNPICDSGTSCKCDTSADTTCESNIHSICDGYSSTTPFTGGSCKCGTSAGSGSNKECSGALGACFVAPGSALNTATCKVNQWTSCSQQEKYY